MSLAAASDFSAPATIQGADGATVTLSSSPEFLKIEYSTDAGRSGERSIFLAFDTDPHTGSSVLPFEKSREGSTVFLPFNAEVFYCVQAGGKAAPAVTKRAWNISQWSDRADAGAEVKVEAGAQDCTLQIPWSALGGAGRKASLVLYSKDLRANGGWGELFGCSDAAVPAGTGHKTIPGFFEYSAAGATPGAAYRARLDTGSRVRIYQLLVRLFGNTNETRKVNGTLAENGVGKFADINDAALDAIAGMNFTHVWLTGVLQQATATDYSAIGEPADDPDLLKGLAGSPYAVKDYFDVCPDYAVDPKQRLAEFKALIARIHAHKLKVLIDLVPNHVARSYKSDVMPDLSFGATDDKTKFFDAKNNFFYLRPSDPGGGPPLKMPTCRDGVPISPTCKVLAGKCDGFYSEEKDFGRVTGNDVVSWAPRIDDWYETVKLNYGLNFTDPHAPREFPLADQPAKPIPGTWEKMDRILEYWQAMGVDGFRCDMAHMEPPEFWHWAIGRARARQPHVFFMAEAYDNDPAKVRGSDPVVEGLNDGRGNVMFDLLNAGFNSVYDDPTYKALKNLYDGDAWANDVDRALGPEFIFQNSQRYCENHDEVRLAGKDQWGRIGMEVGRPVAAILWGLGRGPAMLYNGQEVGEPGAGPAGFGGDNARTTIFDYWSMPELVKWVNGHKYDGGKLSEPQKNLRLFYTRLLALIGEPAFRDGAFFPLNAANARSANFGNVEGDPASGHWMYAFLRHDIRSGQSFLVIANLHRGTAFKNVHVHFPPEALKFLNLSKEPGSFPLAFRERLSPGKNLALNVATGAELSTTGLVIPEIAPLTPLYFEIGTAAKK